MAPRNPIFHDRGRSVFFVDAYFDYDCMTPAAVHEVVSSRRRAKKLILYIERRLSLDGRVCFKIQKAWQADLWGTGWEIYHRRFRCRIEA